MTDHSLGDPVKSTYDHYCDIIRGVKDQVDSVISMNGLVKRVEDFFTLWRDNTGRILTEQLSGAAPRPRPSPEPAEVPAEVPTGKPAEEPAEEPAWEPAEETPGEPKSKRARVKEEKDGDESEGVPLGAELDGAIEGYVGLGDLSERPCPNYIFSSYQGDGKKVKPKKGVLRINLVKGVMKIGKSPEQFFSNISCTFDT